MAQPKSKAMAKESAAPEDRDVMYGMKSASAAQGALMKQMDCDQLEDLQDEMADLQEDYSMQAMRARPQEQMMQMEREEFLMDQLNDLEAEAASDNGRRDECMAMLAAPQMCMSAA